MTYGRRMLAVLVATAMIQVVVRVYDVRYLLRPKSGQVQLSGNRLLSGLRRIGPCDDVANVFEIEAGIEQKPPFLMLDEHPIDREALHAGQAGIQEQVSAVQAHGAAIEEIHFRGFHDSPLLRKIHRWFSKAHIRSVMPGAAPPGPYWRCAGA